MSVPLITPSARRDIRAIWRYIARDSIRHADLVEAAILQTCDLAGEMPKIGIVGLNSPIKIYGFLS